MTPKLIKTDSDYTEALCRIETLFDAIPGTSEGDELEFWITLVELYERKQFPIEAPDPIGAIRFRMEQLGLQQVDLVPFIGSRSKVSEVLSGKRPLSIAMIRKLNTGLGIPAEVLLGDCVNRRLPQTIPDICFRFPFNEMYKRGWFEGFSGNLNEAKSHMEELLRSFVGTGYDAEKECFLHRQRIAKGAEMNDAALEAWHIRVRQLASREQLPAWKSGTVTSEFLREIARLSYFETGPLLAREYLNKNGIHLVFEERMNRTRLDGAAFCLKDKSPVIALTLRYDRLDYFWFTLFHELAHIALHLDKDGSEAFFDDLSNPGTTAFETEADAFASNMLIPKEIWEDAALSPASTPGEVTAFAERLRISPAIPAGRLRYESGNYSLFSRLVGNGKLRILFPDKMTPLH
ncbi:MAG: Antitoxin HigA [Spirochaetes bacterium ADurb.Bin269]|nr:MAG: Antitoxin HigA [Spirochaetes bacterium ADurb.Bin269]